MKIVHVISGLSTGGAEMMLYKLISAWDRRIDSQVISLTDVGVVGHRIQQLGVPVAALGMRRGRIGFSALLRLWRLFRKISPRLIQTWMYHADLLGGLVARFTGRAPVVWGVRNGVLEPHGNKRTTIWTAKFCALLSNRVPRKIICCSQSARDFHENIGYQADRMVVIPNGFDLNVFKPDGEARRTIRQELKLSEDVLLIGLVARFDPQKDHRNFIGAARLLLATHPDVHFVLCGDGVDERNSVIANWTEGHGIKNRFHLLGRRDDIPRITAALDVATSSSYGEAFPNVLGEAMACGVPCVATDAGDSETIVGATGKIVPKKRPGALANAWLDLIAMGPERRRQLGERSRQRVKENFDLNVVARRYDALYREVVQRPGQSRN